MPEKVLDIQALGPLLLGTGRPFQADDTETQALSLPLPLPGSVAGLVRSQVGKTRQLNWSVATERALQDLHAIPVYGPLLARTPVGATGQISDSNTELVFPAPLDAVIWKQEENLRITALRPQPLQPEEGCDLPEGLMPLMPQAPMDGKRETGHVYWSTRDVLPWLLDEKTTVPEKIGHLPVESRTHVSIDPQSRTGEDGKLFGVDYRVLESKTASQHHQWSLRARCKLQDNPAPLGHLGGERRSVVITVQDDLPRHWWDAPAQIKTAFANLTTEPSKTRHPLIRMVLATPALFQEGWKPGWITQVGINTAPRGLSKVKLRLVAACVGKREAVSGWNLRMKQPKEVRWMVPAGSVYFFEVMEGDPASVLESWLRPVSDLEQDRKDGYGLALWGVVK